MGMTIEKYRVSLPSDWSSAIYWFNFITHCHVNLIDIHGGYHTYRDFDAFVNQQLKPHGKFIRTRCQSDYLRWDDPKYHTAFVLRWA
jgi:hypothetical protein